MGLHVTPYGTFYVQRSLRTGEVMQVLPVRRPETPSHLPSVDSLGITDNFIERRRASLAANNARATSSQDSLQRELASAGGERLLETGKAVLAQQDDGSAYGETAMELDPGEPQGGNNSGSGNKHRDSDRKGKRRSSPSQARHDVNTDPRHPEMVLSPQQVHPDQGWPEALPRREPVNLPPFREIDSARVLSQDGLAYEAYEQYERDGRTSRATSSRQHRTRSSRSNSTSTSSSMASQDSTSSFTTVGSTSSVSTAVLSPLAEYDCQQPQPQQPQQNLQSLQSLHHQQNLQNLQHHHQQHLQHQQNLHHHQHHHHHHHQRTDRQPGHDLGDRDAAASSPMRAISAAANPTASSRKRNKTVWIIRTLQPRKPRPKRPDGHDDYDYDEEPQEVETLVETHVQDGSDAGFV